MNFCRKAARCLGLDIGGIVGPLTFYLSGNKLRIINVRNSNKLLV